MGGVGKKKEKPCRHNWERVGEITFPDVVRRPYDSSVLERCKKCSLENTRTPDYWESDFARQQAIEKLTFQRCGFVHLHETDDCVTALANELHKLIDMVKNAKISW